MTMDANDFQNLFSADELAQLEAASADAIAEATPKKDGIWYVNDHQNADGHSQSSYAVNVAGKTILWISVDNDLEVSADELGGHAPLGVTAHRIRVWNAAQDAFLDTKGVAARYLHDDGTGTHVDGNTVRAYVIPRVYRWIAHFYGV